MCPVQAAGSSNRDKSVIFCGLISFRVIGQLWLARNVLRIVSWRGDTRDGRCPPAPRCHDMSLCVSVGGIMDHKTVLHQVGNLLTVCCLPSFSIRLRSKLSH